jgi:hypothetical protein
MKVQFLGAPNGLAPCAIYMYERNRTCREDTVFKQGVMGDRLLV